VEYVDIRGVKEPYPVRRPDDNKGENLLVAASEKGRRETRQKQKKRKEPPWSQRAGGEGTHL